MHIKLVIINRILERQRGTGTGRINSRVRQLFQLMYTVLFATHTHKKKKFFKNTHTQGLQEYYGSFTLNILLQVYYNDGLVSLRQHKYLEHHTLSHSIATFLVIYLQNS